MKNENMSSDRLTKKMSTQMESDSESDLDKTGGQLFAKENLPALITLLVLTCITALVWTVLSNEVGQAYSADASHIQSVLFVAVFVVGMTFNFFIFFLMSFAIQQRYKAVYAMNSVTEQVRHKIQQINVNEQRFELALTGAGDGLWDKNLELGTVYFAPRWKAILGYEDDELVNSQEEWFKRIHPDDLATIRFNEKAYMDGNAERFQHEYRLRHKDGSYIWVLDRGLALSDQTGKVMRLVGVMSDIGERKRVEKLKGEFVSTVSHELRTPLTSIAASLGLLEAGVFGALPDKALSLVNIASKNSKRLTTLVNDILDIEKLISGKASLRSDEIDLIDLIKQSMELNFDIASSFGVNITLSSVSECRHVIGDKDRLLQVMGNLISNATKFSSHDNVVEIRITQLDKFAKVEIEDHGIGIAPEFRSRIFDGFAQADISDTRKHGGTGLGLSITKKLIEKMGGEIGYVSEFGLGSTFWFTLPSTSAWNFSVE